MSNYLDLLWADIKVPYHIEGGQPSYLIIAGLVFTPLSEPLIEYGLFFLQCAIFIQYFFKHMHTKIYIYSLLLH